MRKLAIIGIVAGLLAVMVAPVFAQSTRVPFDFTAGGLIPAEHCIQAFDPWAVQSLAQSYVDLSGNGNNAIVTVPPTLATDGWQFNGVNQFVDSGIIPVSSYSIAIYYADYERVADYRPVAGVYKSGEYFHVSPWHRSTWGTRCGYGNVQASSIDGEPRLLTGVAVLSGAEDPSDPGYGGQIWLDGELQIVGGLDYIGGDRSTVYVSALLIGAAQTATTPAYARVSVTRWAVYDIPLSAAQAAALSAEMAEFNTEEPTSPPASLLYDFTAVSIFTTASEVFNALSTVIVLVAGIALGFTVTSMIMARLRR